MQQSRWVSGEVGRGLEGLVENLRWCKEHLADRHVTARLQQIQMQLGAYALALDYAMGGDDREGQRALEQAEWGELRRSRPRAKWDIPGH